MWSSYSNIGSFRVLLSCHTKTHLVSHSILDRDSSVNSTWLQSLCIQPRCSAAYLLRAARCLTVNGMHSTGLYAYRPRSWRLFRIVWLETLRPAKRNSLTRKHSKVVVFKKYWKNIYDFTLHKTSEREKIIGWNGAQRPQKITKINHFWWFSTVRRFSGGKTE